MLYRKFIMTMGFISLTITGHSFELTSQDIAEGEMLSTLHEFDGFGCQGGNQSPMLKWSNVPEGTEYFAITAYDPDAPTGSGWWHWQIINIPKDVLSLARDAGNVDQAKIPEGAVQMRNDYGVYGFGGACPPSSGGQHRYQFTVYALSSQLDLPKDASGAMVGFMLKANMLGSSTVEAVYERK